MAIAGADPPGCFTCSITNDCNHYRTVSVYCAAPPDAEPHAERFLSFPLLPFQTHTFSETCGQPCKLVTDDQPWTGGGGVVQSADLAIILIGSLLTLVLGLSLFFLSFIVSGGRWHKRRTERDDDIAGGGSDGAEEWEMRGGAGMRRRGSRSRPGDPPPLLADGGASDDGAAMDDAASNPGLEESYAGDVHDGPAAAALPAGDTVGVLIDTS